MYDDVYLPAPQDASAYDFEQPRPEGIDIVVYTVGPAIPRKDWAKGETVDLLCLMAGPKGPSTLATLSFVNDGTVDMLSLKKQAYALACAKLHAEV